jgi:hypothetical protein
MNPPEWPPACACDPGNLKDELNMHVWTGIMESVGYAESYWETIDVRQ